MGVMGVVVNRTGISLGTSGSAGWGECMCNRGNGGSACVMGVMCVVVSMTAVWVNV